MKHAATLTFVALALTACSSGQKEPATATQKQVSEVQARLDSATQLVADFRGQIPDPVATKAKCVIVVPGLKKGGLIVGGEGGKGFATCYAGGSWSEPAPLSVGGGTLGAQVGYQSADVLSILTSDKAVKALDEGNMKVGGDLSASAGPVGTGTSKSGDVTVVSDVVSYSKSSGLFAGATLEGTTVQADKDATMALYGSAPDMATILERRGALPEDASVQRFRAAVQSAFVPAAVGMTGSAIGNMH
jgi:lipid-binding SYLF domain-containing protein